MSSLIKSVIAQAMVRDVGYGVPSQDQVSTAVDTYLQRNPVEPGATTEEAAQIRQNTEAVGALKQSDEQQNTEIQKHATAIENLQKNETGNGSGGNAEDGFFPIATVEQTATGAVISITDKDGTTTATITNGKDGKTPEKGVDYYTDTDKTEMVNAVLSALPTWNGGSY